MQFKESLLPTAFARAVEVESLMAFDKKPGNEPPPHVHEREHELYPGFGMPVR